MAGIEPMQSKSNDWTTLLPCQLGQGGGLYVPWQTISECSTARAAAHILGHRGPTSSRNNCMKCYKQKSRKQVLTAQKKTGNVIMVKKIQSKGRCNLSVQ
jgi:hypothetical protein